MAGCRRRQVGLIAEGHQQVGAELELLIERQGLGLAQALQPEVGQVEQGALERGLELVAPVQQGLGATQLTALKQQGRKIEQRLRLIAELAQQGLGRQIEQRPIGLGRCQLGPMQLRVARVARPPGFQPSAARRRQQAGCRTAQVILGPGFTGGQGPEIEAVGRVRLAIC